MSLRPRRVFAVLAAVAWVVLAGAAQTEPAGDTADADSRPYFVAPLTLPNTADAIGYAHAVTADPVTGEVFVCDSRKNRVVIFSKDAEFEYQIPGGRLFSSPTDLAVDPNGFLLVLANHDLRRTILELDYDGLLLGEIRVAGKLAPVDHSGFRSLAISPSGNRLFILDQFNLTLWIADRDGAVRNSVDLGADLTERKRADMILGKVDVYGDTVVVVISSHSMVRTFDLDGNPLGNTGVKGTGPGQIGFAMAAALDVDGKLMIVDQQRMYILHWDPELNACIGEYSGPGTLDGYLYYPLDISVDPQGRLYVSQGLRGRVHAFGGFPAAAREGSHPEATVVKEPGPKKYAPRTRDPLDEVQMTVWEWSRARSEPTLDEYFNYYSESFHPAGFRDREAWRASQFLASQRLDVGVTELEVALIQGGFARATFVETRPSDPDGSPARKTLLLRRETDGWKILEERTEPFSAASGSTPTEE